MGKDKIFEYELSFIKDSKIKEFTIKAINKLPDYFFEVAASSTGKYHPQYTLGKGGLIRHTKAAVRIALELFNNHSIHKYDNLQKDIIISALILHDGAKHGLNGSKFTVTEHPLVVVDILKDDGELSNILDNETLEILLSGIATHMGEWNADYKTKKEVLEKPKTGMQRFIHMCDYLASRKCIEINFDA